MPNKDDINGGQRYYYKKHSDRRLKSLGKQKKNSLSKEIEDT
jgi:hypothetical protein